MHTLVHPATPSTASRMETHPNTQSQPAQEGRNTTRQDGIKLGGPHCRRPSMSIRAHGPTQVRKRAAREHVQPTLLKVQSTSPTSGHFRRFSAKWTAVWDTPGDSTRTNSKAGPRPRATRPMPRRRKLRRLSGTPPSLTLSQWTTASTTLRLERSKRSRRIACT